MNRILAVLSALLLSAASLASATQKDAAPREYYGRIARRLSAMLPRCHVLQRPLDDEISRRAWTNLVTFYDFDHSVFLKSDLEALAARETTLDDELRAGDVSFGYDLRSLYCRRLRERIDFATNLLAATNWDFSSAESYRIKRKDAPWPETREDAEDYWRRRIKNEVLAMTLSREIEAEKAKEKKAKKNKDAEKEKERDAEAAEDAGTDAGDGKPQDSVVESLTKKYRQYAIVMCEPDEESVLQHYFSAVCRACDPHTDYMSPASKDDFDMEMSLTLCGVGAVLSMDDGALKISEVMPGGPMDIDGRIKAGDKIVAVGQEDGKMEDVLWQPMNKSIRKIRGKKGTRVTLDIIPRDDPAGATHRLIELVRDEIKLDEQAATGHVEKVELDGFQAKIGYVYLPGFYGTMDKRPGDEGYVSCAADVAKYVAEFNAAGAGGMILDLRGDGGGSLKEAVQLSSLFVPDGPVVIVRDVFNTVPLQIPRGNPAAFRKPLVVLTDRASASASEIVAGFLRDTGRAIVLGDVRTHGKGTVQSVMGLGPEKYGSMKITTARFYRIDGRSTQVEGVAADIHLPSFFDTLDIGEDKLPNALPFSRIRPARYRKCWNMDTYIPALAERSAARTAADSKYARHLANVKAAKEIYEREEVPLERAARKAMMLADMKVRDTASDSDWETVSGEDADAGEGTDAAAKDEGADAGAKDEGAKKPAPPPARTRRRRGRPSPDADPVLAEAYRIVADLVRLNGGAELPPPAIDWYNAIFGF